MALFDKLGDKSITIVALITCTIWRHLFCKAAFNHNNIQITSTQCYKEGETGDTSVCPSRRGEKSK